MTDDDDTPDWTAPPRLPVTDDDRALIGRRMRRSPVMGVPVSEYASDLTPPPHDLPTDRVWRHVDKHVAKLREGQALLESKHDSAMRRIANLELTQHETSKAMVELKQIATATSTTVAHLSVQLDKLVSSSTNRAADRGAWARTLVGLVVPTLALLASILIALNR